MTIKIDTVEFVSNALGCLGMLGAYKMLSAERKMTLEYGDVKTGNLSNLGMTVACFFLSDAVGGMIARTTKTWMKERQRRKQEETEAAEPEKNEEEAEDGRNEN